jgi:hypothetical protein
MILILGSFLVASAQRWVNLFGAVPDAHPDVTVGAGFSGTVTDLDTAPITVIMVGLDAGFRIHGHAEKSRHGQNRQSNFLHGFLLLGL